MIGVIYIARERESYLPFIESYLAYKAGHKNELIVVYKGARVIPPAQYIDRWREIFMFDWGYDFRAYRKAMEQYPEFDSYCFLGSSSVIEGDNWLYKLHYPTTLGFKMVGCTGSCESFYSNNPTWYNRDEFLPFPNPHIRTTGFLMPNEIAFKYMPKRALTKRQAYKHEHGKNGITQKLWKDGHNVCVISSHGNMSSIEDAKTFRSDGASLISDKQTRIYENSSKMEIHAKC